MALPWGRTAHSGPSSRLALGRLSPWPRFFKPSRPPSPAARASLCSKGQVFGEDAQRVLARSLRPAGVLTGSRAFGAQASLAPYHADRGLRSQSRSLVFSGAKASMPTSLIHWPTH